MQHAAIAQYTFDAAHHLIQFYWRIKAGTRIPPGHDAIPRAVHHSMHNQLLILPEDDDRTRRQGRGMATMDGQQIAGPEGWEHAGAGHAQLNLPRSTDCFG